MDFLNFFSGGDGNSLIMHRDPGSASGSDFISHNTYLTGNTRDINILNEFLHGNIPDFLRNFKSITVADETNSLTYLVMSDILSIGSDDDYIRMPMTPIVAKAIADKYDCTLPTKKMCQQIWQNAEIKLNPHPKGAPYDQSMMMTQTIDWHNTIINQQLQSQDKTKLITGHKKDIIIDKQLLFNKNKVGIFGWFYANGSAIQGPQPNCSDHSSDYLDYSHGVRLIAQDVIVNGSPARLFDVLNNPKYCSLISEQGSFDASKIYKY